MGNPSTTDTCKQRWPTESAVEETAGPAARKTWLEAGATPRPPPPAAQPARFVLALALIAAGAALYGFALTGFWSSAVSEPHDRIPYPAYLLIAGALMLALAVCDCRWELLATRQAGGNRHARPFHLRSPRIGGGRFAKQHLDRHAEPALHTPPRNRRSLSATSPCMTNARRHSYAA